MSQPVRSNKRRWSFPLTILAVAGATLLVAACSSPSKASTSSPTNAPTPAAGSATTVAGSSASDASVTVGVANVPGVGNVLVNGDGRTLYVLASEKGGKVTCTSTGGCTTAWPAVVLPSGMTHGIAGAGVQASLFGTVTGPAGDVRLTYAGWPLYTFFKDTGPGQATGQGVRDAFGLWWVLSPSGEPITTTAATSTPAQAPATSPPATSPPTTPAPSSGGAGF